MSNNVISDTNVSFQFPLWDTQKKIDMTETKSVLLSIPFMGYSSMQCFMRN